MSMVASTPVASKMITNTHMVTGLKTAVLIKVFMPYLPVLYVNKKQLSFYVINYMIFDI